MLLKADSHQLVCRFGVSVKRTGRRLPRCSQWSMDSLLFLFQLRILSSSSVDENLTLLYWEQVMIAQLKALPDEYVSHTESKTHALFRATNEEERITSTGV